MSRFDRPHSSNQHAAEPLAESLIEALHDVPIPEGLQHRLLESVSPVRPKPESGARSFSLTRRTWLGLAVGVGGVVCGGSAYAYARRALTPTEVVDAITEVYWQDDWLIEWNTGPAPTMYPFPPFLRRAQGWQPRPTRISRQGVAFELSQPGCDAVLFAIKTLRGRTAFPDVPPPSPAPLTKAAWSHVAVWQGPQSLLYVLALRGAKRDYSRLFTTGSSMAPLA